MFATKRSPTFLKSRGSDFLNCVVTTELSNLTTEPSDLTTEVADLTTELSDLTTELSDLTTEVCVVRSQFHSLPQHYKFTSPQTLTLRASASLREAKLTPNFCEMPDNTVEASSSCI
jgi:hypothetical protein